MQENVLFSLNSLAKKDFRREDGEMPAYLRAMAESPDPVGITRNVVDNFYGALIAQEDQFKALEEEAAEEVSQAYTAQDAIAANQQRIEESPWIVDYRDGKVLYGGLVHHDVQPKGKVYAQGSIDRLRHNS